ncbi:MAG: DUF2505 domain-containing protein [Nocardioidaceae bacterium]
MRLNESVPYEGATPQQVFELICDEGFRDDVCEKVHAVSHDVTVERDGDTAKVTITRVMPADVPDFIKKITGETVEVVQTEKWARPDADGSRTGTVEVRITGQPASMTGKTAVRAATGGATLSVDGDVTVKIPLLGKRFEPELANAIIAALRTEAAEGAARLRR